MTDLLNFFKTVRRLTFIERCSNILHIHKSTVSDHSFYVALYAMVFADMENYKILNEVGEAIGNGVGNDKKLSKEKVRNLLYNTSEVVKRSLIHDLEESLTGDILYPVKHEVRPAKLLLDQAIQSVVNNELFESIPDYSTKKYYKILWQKSKDNSKEGRLVAAMDKFEILMYSLQEILLGNKQFGIIFKTAFDILRTEFKSIETLQGVLDSIEKEVSTYGLNLVSQKDVNNE